MREHNFGELVFDLGEARFGLSNPKTIYTYMHTRLSARSWFDRFASSTGWLRVTPASDCKMCDLLATVTPTSDCKVCGLT